MQEKAEVPAGGGEAAAPHVPGTQTGAGAAAGRWAGVLAMFTATTFLSALLLFSVQPMFARMVLPILGGSPSVWAVAMLFFQAALLAGYCYAHVLIRTLRPVPGGILHLCVCLVAVAALPIGVPQGLGDPPAGDPALWQLGLFTLGVGLPFFAVSANAPLLQAWFAASGHPHGRDPYFLYGASNLGSLLALLAYPLLLEPAFGVRALAWIWAGGFAALAALLGLSLLATARGIAGRGVDGVGVSAASSPLAPPGPSTGDRPSLARRLGWIGLAFVPSALLTAFTNHITMDVASAPLLWVLPLALYLLTFVLVFRDPPIVLLPTALLVALSAAACWSFFGGKIWDLEITTWGTILISAAAALAFFAVTRLLLGMSSLEGLGAVHLGTLALALLALSQTEHEGWFVTASTGLAVFFAATMVAHRTLYETRPPASRLTEFYLLMSLGGVLGGVFAALIAPRIFSQVFEYPILLALTVACRPGALRLRDSKGWVDNLLSLWLVVASSILAIIWLPSLIDQLPAVDSAEIPLSAWWIKGLTEIYAWLRESATRWGSTATLSLVFAIAMLALWRHPVRQLALAAALCATVVLLPSAVRRSAAERSYFGVYRIYSSGQYNVLTHGTTLHGAQKMRDGQGNPAPETTPGTYYYPDSPMARSVVLAREHIAGKGGTGRFGIIGLGAGSLACLAAEGERWRFFEIDPLMLRMSSNPDNFTYLSSCQPSPPDIVIGDARLTLAREPDGAFDLIIVDAFTSDAVPIHLMTAEALRLYLGKTSPKGVAVLHVSNRYLDLDSVLAATIALVPGTHGLVVADDEADGTYGQSTSTVVLIAKSEEALAPFRSMKGMRELDAKKLRGWTDDFSDIIGPFRAKMKN